MIEAQTIRDYKVVRTLALGFTLFLTWEAYDFVFEHIASGKIRQEWMVAQILAPITMLQGAVFKFFADPDN